MQIEILVSKDIQALIGDGEEWLVAQDGTILAKFYDGNLINSQMVSIEITKDGIC